MAGHMDESVLKDYSDCPASRAAQAREVTRHGGVGRATPGRRGRDMPLLGRRTSPSATSRPSKFRREGTLFRDPALSFGKIDLSYRIQETTAAVAHNLQWLQVPMSVSFWERV